MSVSVVMLQYGRWESQSTLQRNFLQSPWFAQFPVDFCGWQEHLLDCKWALLPLWCWLVNVLADLGCLLPSFWSALPVALVCLNKLSSRLLDKLLDGNFLTVLPSPIFQFFSSFQLRLHHLHLFYSYCSITTLTDDIDVTHYIYIEYLISRLLNINLW